MTTEAEVDFVVGDGRGRCGVSVGVGPGAGDLGGGAGADPAVGLVVAGVDVARSQGPVRIAPTGRFVTAGAET